MLIQQVQSQLSSSGCELKLVYGGIDDTMFQLQGLSDAGLQLVDPSLHQNYRQDAVPPVTEVMEKELVVLEPFEPAG